MEEEGTGSEWFRQLTMRTRGVRSAGPRDPIGDLLYRSESHIDRGTQTHAAGFLEAIGYPSEMYYPAIVRQALQDPRLDDDHKHYVYMKYMNHIEQKLRVAIRTAGFAFC